MSDGKEKQFYDSAAWQEKREQILRRDHYECQDCIARLRNAAREGIILKGKERRIRRATCVHHIVELRDNWDLRLDDNNLISLCDGCHNKRHGRVLDAQWSEEGRQGWLKRKRLTDEMW